MITSTKYIRPNITIDTEIFGAKKFYIYNYQGVHYRVFSSLLGLQTFVLNETKTWDFECGNEFQLEQYFKNIV